MDENPDGLIDLQKIELLERIAEQCAGINTNLREIVFLLKVLLFAAVPMATATLATYWDWL